MVHSFKVAIQCGIWWFTTIFNPYSPMDIKLVLWFLGHPTIGDSEPMFSLIYNHILEVYPIFRHTKWVDSDPFSGFWLCFFPRLLHFGQNLRHFSSVSGWHDGSTLHEIGGMALFSAPGAGWARSADDRVMRMADAPWWNSWIDGISHGIPWY
jgi:hypothetical protein